MIYFPDTPHNEHLSIQEIVHLLGKDVVNGTVCHLVEVYGTNWLDYLIVYGDSVNITNVNQFVQSLFSKLTLFKGHYIFIVKIGHNMV